MKNIIVAVAVALVVLPSPARAKDCRVCPPGSEWLIAQWVLQKIGPNTYELAVLGMEDGEYGPNEEWPHSLLKLTGKQYEIFREGPLVPYPCVSTTTKNVLVKMRNGFSKTYTQFTETACK